MFLPIPLKGAFVLIFFSCEKHPIPSCLFGNINGSSGRPGDQNDVWLSIMKKRCACSSLRYHTASAGWWLKILLVSTIWFQLLEIILFDGSGGLTEPTRIVWGWEYELDTIARYTCEMNALKVKRSMATVLYAGYWLATHWKAEVLVCVF